MSVQELQQAHRYAAADGYIALYELPRIKRAALLHDNTVDSQERAYLKDVIQRGFMADPGVLGELQRLAFYGETSISSQMAELRRRKEREHWFDSEYVAQATPVLLASTDHVERRLDALFQLAREARITESDVAELGRRILLTSNDPLQNRLAALARLAREAGFFDSDVKIQGMSLIRTAYDRPEARRQGVETLDRMVHLWESDKEELSQWIGRDDQSLEG